MRKVISATFVTMDGVMQGPGGPEEDRSGGFDQGGWTAPLSDETVGAAVDATMRARFDLLLGRRTYEIFAAHWPFVENDPIADRFNAATKYVATNSGSELTWANSVALAGDVAAKIAELKREDGPNLFVWGSSVLFETLLANDLVDELTLLVYPIVLAKGKRLFSQGVIPRAFELVSSKASPNGVVISTYRLAGEVRTGSFALDEPTELEIERRQRHNVEV
jgi:dihydrofolate reductase